MNILRGDPAIRRCHIDIGSLDEEWTSPSRLPACYVINTDDNAGSGEHWVSFFIDTDCSADYWDSYGTVHCNQFIHGFSVKVVIPLGIIEKWYRDSHHKPVGPTAHISCTCGPWGSRWTWFQTHSKGISSISTIHLSVLYWENWDDNPIIRNEWPWITIYNSYSARYVIGR